MIKTLGITGNVAKAELTPLGLELLRWSRARGVQVRADDLLAEALEAKEPQCVVSRNGWEVCDLICVMGGDGFLLHAARLIHPASTPILTVNLGSLGFNAQVRPGEILEVLKLIHENGVSTSSRPLLRVEKKSAAGEIFEDIALNDAVVIKETRSRLIHAAIAIDGEALGEVTCDGIVISTGTGSTAYNLSAGGPLMHPSLEAFAVTPLGPHTLSSRPVIVPSSSEITLKLIIRKDRESALLCLDGQHWRKMDHEDEIVIKRSRAPLIMADVHPERYYHKLRSKFRWAISPYDDF